MSLVARHLESNGIPSLIIGSAIDIVEHCNVPRYVHVDFPLGNPCGKPYDKSMQLAIMQEAMDFFACAKASKAVRRLTWRWADTEDWRDAYAQVNESNRQQLLEAGRLRRRQQEESRGSGKAWLNRIE